MLRHSSLKSSCLESRLAGADAALTRPLRAVRQVVGGRVLRAGVGCGGEDLLEAAPALGGADLCLDSGYCILNFLLKRLEAGRISHVPELPGDGAAQRAEGR